MSGLVTFFPLKKYELADDLESFFWLILWCVVEHVDNPDTERTETAELILRQLDRKDLANIATRKAAILAEDS